jgi:hypothetical protein
LAEIFLALLVVIGFAWAAEYSPQVLAILVLGGLGISVALVLGGAIRG